MALWPALALAQLVPPVNPAPLPGNISIVIQQVINFGAGLVIAGAVVFIIYAAILYLVSDLADTKERAKNVMLYSVVAVAVALLASVIVNVVFNVLRPFSGG